MSQPVTEIIWHFAGYLHIADILAYEAVAFSGAPVFRTAGYGSHEHEGGPSGLRLPAIGNSKPVVTFEPQAGPAAEKVPLLQLNFHAQALSASAFAELPAIEFEFANPIGPIAYGASFGGASGPEIHVTYSEVPTYVFDITIAQTNILFDLDTLLGDAIKLPDGTVPPIDPLVAGMIDAAEALIPEWALPSMSPSGVDAEGNATPFNPAPIGTAGEDGATALAVEETSEYVNGVHTDGPTGTGHPIDAGSAIAAQIADISDAIVNFNPPEDEGAAPPPGSEAESGAPQNIAVENHGTPTGGYAQESLTGENEALNIAILEDQADALSSLVIGGDYHETNAIIQINILHDNDTVNVSGAGVAQSIIAGNNSLTNEATFVADPGSVFGDGVSGFSGALEWHVTYVDGDYWNIATLTQTNVIIDGDLSEQTTANTHYTAVLGANNQLSFVALAEGAPVYDLIIIDGDYVDYNTVLQINVVLDDDVVFQMLGGEGSQSVDAGTNTLRNDASIVSIGSEDFKPLTGNAAALADAIAAQDASIDAIAALGLPGNGTGSLNILYVSGDYYDLDLLVQTNVIADADSIAQLAPDGAQGIEGADTSGGLSQTATAGANSAANIALIVDVDSLSGYQYLGGEVYEDTLLVQANIIIDDDEYLTSTDLHPDVVAALAAMSESDADHVQSGYATDAEASDPAGASSDVLGGVMA